MWRFTVCGVLFLVVLNLGLSFAPTISKHGCAPVVPPAVSGTLVQPAASRGFLFINEALLVPHSTWNCGELGTYSPTNDSWLEIYNAQDQPFDLYSVHTNIDSGPNTNPFYLPFGAAIAPHGFLTVFPRMDANFLSTETATLRLLIGGTVVDEVTIPSLGEDQSYARTLDGSPTWLITNTPTISSSNVASLIKPTATKTKVEATATARVTKGKKGAVSTNKGGRGSGGIGGGTGTTNGPQVDGVQPEWNNLHHPDLVTSTSPSTTQQPGALFSPGSNGDPGILHKIFLTLLIIALAFSLFWCWRLFRIP